MFGWPAAMSSTTMFLGRSNVFRVLLVATVCLSSLMLMLSFRVATNPSYGVMIERQLAIQMTPSPAAMRPLRTAAPATVAAATAARPVQQGAIDATDYPFLIEHADICERQRPDVFVLVYVHTAPDHFKHRAVIRQTWGHSKLYGRLGTVTVFFVGRARDPDVEAALRLESERYGDLVQADYVDSYKNLSLKAVVALRWITEHCPRPLYVLKVDDDMFVNVFNLVRHLHVLHKYEGEKRSISCLVWSSMPVLRSPKSKWFVSKEEFADDRYPPYCSGSAFFMPTAVTFLLYNASFSAPFLWVDDVYATGILAREAFVPHSSISSIVTLSQDKYDSQLIQGEAVFGHMTGDKGVDLRFQYWKKVLQKEEWAVS